MSAECSNPTRRNHMRVYFFILKPPYITAKEASLIIGIHILRLNPMLNDVIFTSHLKYRRIGRSTLNRAANLLAGAGFQHFIRINLQDPFIRALRDGPVLLLGGVDVF